MFKNAFLKPKHVGLFSCLPMLVGALGLVFHLNSQVCHAAPQPTTPAVLDKAQPPDEEHIGITDTTIQLGSCLPLTGPVSDRGNKVREGASLYFNSINSHGGIDGRKILFDVYDDRYDPEKAEAAFEENLKGKVFAGTCFVGSAPITKYIKLADITKTPMVGFCNGVPVVYEHHPRQFSLRSSYLEEMDVAVDELWKRGVRRFAVIYQSDVFGLAIRDALSKALARHNTAAVSEASFQRLTGKIDSPYKSIKDSNPQAVVIGAAVQIPLILKKRADDKWNALFWTTSVGTDYLIKAGTLSDGVIATEVIPAMDAKVPAIAHLQKLRAEAKSQGPLTASAIEGFINALVVVEGLKRAGHDLSRTKFVQALESIDNKDIGAGPQFRVSFSPKNHVGFSPKSIYMATFEGGKMVPITDDLWKNVLKNAGVKQ